MSNYTFNPHAKILHNGQYEIIKDDTIDVPIRNFSSVEDYEAQVKRRIDSMQQEIKALEEKIQEKRRISQEKADKILEQVKDDAKKVMEEAEQNAFDRVQQSVQEKEDIIQKSIEEGDRIKLEAQKEFESIKAQAEIEAANIKSKAEKDGFAQGTEEGIINGRSELEFTIERLHNVIAETSRERERILVHSESQVINLILSMVGKVVKKLGQENRDIVVENAKSALALIRSAMTVFIHVSPQDFNHLHSFKQEFIRIMESRSDLKLIEDPTIEPGGVYIETDTGDVDATIRSQLEELENQMRFYMPVKVKSPEKKRREKENTERLVEEQAKKEELEQINKLEKTDFAQQENYKQADPTIIQTDEDPIITPYVNKESESVILEDSGKNPADIVISDDMEPFDNLDNVDIVEDSNQESNQINNMVIDAYKENSDENQENGPHDDFTV